MKSLNAATLALLLVAFGACDPGAGEDIDAGSDQAADSEPVDSSGDLGTDADVASPDDAEEPDLSTDEGAPACPPLTDEEAALILGGEANAAMEFVTNRTPEGDAFLHEPSPCVDPLDPTVAHLISRMRRTLAASFGGVGLAAPQVGIHRRIFLAQRTDQPGRPVQAFLNPQIVEYSPETGSMMEGCLSVPDASPSVVRSLRVVIDYDGEDAWPVVGESIGGARGTQAAYAARIVQHEYDHLEGVLIVDPR